MACLPRFDAGACFAALLGKPDHGRWLIAPASGEHAHTRRYCGTSLVLEHEFRTSTGTEGLVDCMPPRRREPDLVRLVEGVSGHVDMRMELVVRFDYGGIVPWVRSIDDTLRAIAGPDALSLWTPVRTRGVERTTQSEFTVRAGDRIPFVVAWHPSHELPPEPPDPTRAIADTQAWWEEWSSRCTYDGAWRDAVVRSLITLKALTYQPTGGIVAAPTTSLPERLGGVRKLRLPLLLDSRRDLYAVRARRRWLHRGSGRLAQLAAASSRRGCCGPADHVRLCR